MVRGINRRIIGFLVLTLLSSCLLTACTATSVKVTLKDLDGAALAGFTVTIGDKSATTDAAGVCTIKGVEPGQAKIKLAGQGVTEEHSETVAKGENAFSYSVNLHPFVFTKLGEVPEMRLKMSSPQGEVAVEAVIVEGQGSHWFFAGGKNQVISTAEAYHVKMGDQPWVTVPADQAGTNLGAMWTEMYIVGLQHLDEDMTAEGVQAVWKGEETVNSYLCDVFEVSAAAEGEPAVLNFYIVKQGEFKGLVTRYAPKDLSQEHAAIVDIWDFGAELTVSAPQ